VVTGKYAAKIVVKLAQTGTMIQMEVKICATTLSNKPRALSKEPNRVGVSLPSPEDGNRSRFRNVVFSNYLEF
jgi:hypothetical protein